MTDDEDSPTWREMAEYWRLRSLRHEEVSKAAYFVLVHQWESHSYAPSGGVFDMTIFAPEVRKLMDEPERALFDAIVKLNGETP